MADEMKSGAEHVLAHGTARTRAAVGKRPGAAHEARAERKPKSKGRIKRMTIEPADDGSHVIRHEHHQPDGDMGMAGKRVEDETYTAPNTEALKQHIEEHLGAMGAEPQGAGAQEPSAEEEGAQASAEPAMSAAPSA